jgi:hypothetical protein
MKIGCYKPLVDNYRISNSRETKDETLARLSTPKLKEYEIRGKLKKLKDEEYVNNDSFTIDKRKLLF